jgi:Etoposide-induced protein 2.4 (EI24)
MNLKEVSAALGRAVQSQFHPKMLLLLIGPFVASITVWLLVAYLVWSPITNWFELTLFGSPDQTKANMGTVYKWLINIGIDQPTRIIPNVLATVLLVPLIFVSAVLFISVLAMPVVIRHLTAEQYADVQRLGSLSVTASALNAFKSLLIFFVGYIVTIPLWFIPPLILVVPWLWWGWLNSRLMRFDSLLEHATPQEREQIIRSYKSDYRLLGLSAAGLNYIPPLFIAAPVFGALAFAHYSLQALRNLRGSSLSATTSSIQKT